MSRTRTSATFLSGCPRSRPVASESCCRIAGSQPQCADRRTVVKTGSPRAYADPADCRDIRCAFDVVVVKGMEGLSEKLGAQLSTCDVASRLALPLVICLRHGPSIQFRLSQALKQARRRDIPLAGWIVTGCDTSVVTVVEELSQNTVHCLGAITKAPRSELELTYGLNLDVLCSHLQLRSATTNPIACH